MLHFPNKIENGLHLDGGVLLQYAHTVAHLVILPEQPTINTNDSNFAYSLELFTYLTSVVNIRTTIIHF